MKTLSGPLVVLLLMTSGCAGSGGGGGGGGSSSGGACSGTAILGTWIGQFASTGDTLTINSDCTFTETQCAMAGTYPNDTNFSDTVTINITTSSGAGSCPAVGVGTLQYNDLSGSLAVKFNGAASWSNYAK